MPIVSGDIVRYAFRQKWDGIEDQVNVLHFRCEDAGTETDEEIVEAVIAHVGAMFVGIEAHIANNITPDVVDVYNVSDDAPLGQYPWVGGYSGGTGSGEALPTTVAALILFPTSVKRKQGRVFLPTFLEAAQADSVWTPTVITAMNTFGTAMLLDVTGPTDSVSQFVVYGRGSGVGTRPTGRRSVPIAASMRSRRKGRGS